MRMTCLNTTLCPNIFSSNNMIMIWRAVGFHWHTDGIVFHYDGFLPGHEGDILCMDHNGQLLGTGSADKTVKLWSGVSKIHRGNGFTTVSDDVPRASRMIPSHSFTVLSTDFRPSRSSLNSWQEVVRRGSHNSQYINKPSNVFLDHYHN